LNLIKANSGKENTTEDMEERPVIVRGVETGTMRMFLVALQERTAETLMAVVKEWTHQGSTAVSDCPGMYKAP
jgi:hypothetical protein